MSEVCGNYSEVEGGMLHALFMATVLTRTDLRSGVGLQTLGLTVGEALLRLRGIATVY